MRTRGLTLVGPLPAECALETSYVATVTTRAQQPDLARRLVDLLMSTEREMVAVRHQCGFEGGATTEPKA